MMQQLYQVARVLPGETAAAPAPSHWQMAGKSVWSGVAVALLVATAVTAQTGREAALGQELERQFLSAHQRIDDPAVRSYLEGLGQRLAPWIPGAPLPFTFTVIADDPCAAIHEPIALPGGRILVPSALFAAAQEEAEFAGMLARAMAGVRPVAAGSFAAGCVDRTAVPVGFLTRQRGAALEADGAAVGAMARAGFDPEALVRYIRRVQVPVNGTASKVFSTLPDRDTRVATMAAAIAKLPPARYGASSVEFAAAAQQMRALTESPARPRTPPSLFRTGPG